MRAFILLTLPLFAAEPVPLLKEGIDDWPSTDKHYWKLEGDTLIASSDKQIPRNVFLWVPGEVSDFHLSFDVKLEPDDGNAGVQFRSKPHGGHEALGYQADVGGPWWGKLYHESGRKLLWDNDRGRKAVKPGEWNRYEILAVGDRIWTAINGTLSVSVRDPIGERSGKIAFQLHSGAPQKVSYRNPVLTRDPKVTIAGLTEEELHAALVPISEADDDR